jgi:hypothetical protein
MKYLVIKAVIGFGDRMESLKMYIDYALKNDLIVHIDWRDSIWSHGEESFYKYFKLNDLKQIEDINEIPKDLKIFPTFWQDKLDTILTEDIIRNNLKDLELNKIDGKTFDCDVLVVTSYGYRSIYSDSSFFYNRFKIIDPRISQEVLIRQKIYNLSKKWALHLRGTDRAKSYDFKSKRMKELNIKLVHHGILNGKQCVIVSDDQDYINFAKQKYKDFPVLSVNTINLGKTGTHALTKDILEITKDQMNVNLLIDFFTLASCEKVFTTILDSRFATESQKAHHFINKIL